MMNDDLKATMIDINTSIKIDIEDLAAQISCQEQEQIHELILMIEGYLCDDAFTRNLIKKLEKALGDYGA